MMENRNWAESGQVSSPGALEKLPFVSALGVRNRWNRSVRPGLRLASRSDGTHPRSRRPSQRNQRQTGRTFGHVSGRFSIVFPAQEIFTCCCCCGWMDSRGSRSQICGCFTWETWNPVEEINKSRRKENTELLLDRLCFLLKILKTEKWVNG